MLGVNNVFKRLPITCLVGTTLLLTPLFSYAACGTGDVGGTVYLELPIKANSSGQESNEYGSRQTDNEAGLANIDVKVIDKNGAVQSATTDSTGAWSVTAPAFPVRVEFSPSTHLFSGPVGTQSKTSVQFLTSSNCNVDMGLQYPEDHSQMLPRLAISNYIAGTGVNETEPALSSYLYDANASYQGQSMAAVSEIGSVWGLAWQANKKRLFGATVLKRHVGIRDGLGYVYVFDQSQHPAGSLVSSFNLQGVAPTNGGAAIDLGSVCRDATCANQAGNTGVASDYVLPDDRTQPSVDLDAFFKVGRVGFGDADMEPYSNTLWLINAYQKALISVDASNNDPKALPGVVKQYPLADLAGLPACQGGELHPWGLGFNRGVGYMGLSCDATSSKNSGDLHAYIVSFDPQNASAGLSPVYDFTLNYQRDFDSYAGMFKPWFLPSSSAEISWLYSGQMHVSYPQGVISDIDFDENGNLYTEVMDIFGMQQGHDQLPPLSQASGSTFRGVALGDLLKICNTSSGYRIEGTAECPASALVASAVGPGGNGEFFNDHSADSNPESALGSLVLIKGARELVSVMVDPHDPSAPMADDRFIYTQGFTSFGLEAGNILRWHTTAYNAPGRFGKAAGVGDIELLSDPAPIEVGNRVWIDTDADGIQDPDEAGIDGVTVKLTCSNSSTQSATVTTANGGEYLFSTASNADFMNEGESCVLSVDPTQAALSTYVSTKQNANGLSDNAPNTDLQDSDAINNKGIAEIAFTVTNAGENNHTLDFGFTTAPETDVSLTKSLNKTTAKRGEQVIYTLTVTNDSKTVDASQLEVTDLVPSGLSYISDDGLSVYGADVYDEASGVWKVGDLPAAGSKTLNITVEVN